MKFFFKNSNIIFFVYDITDLESFNNIKNIWYPQFQENGDENIILGIIGKKSDLFEQEVFDLEENAKKYAKEIGANFMLISAKTGNGVQKLFENFVDLYFNNKNKSKKSVKDQVKFIKKCNNITNFNETIVNIDNNEYVIIENIDNKNDIKNINNNDINIVDNNKDNNLINTNIIINNINDDYDDYDDNSIKNNNIKNNIDNANYINHTNNNNIQSNNNKKCICF